jgi:competence protein ComEC
VGNASATVIELPNGGTLIYDIGSSSDSDVEKWTVGPLLARDHCRRVDAVLLSHANLDHYSGLPDLIARRTVSAVMIPPQFVRDSEGNSTARALMSKLNDRPGLLRMIGQGDRLSGTGAVNVEVLWPPRDLKVSRSNDDSMVVRVSYAGRRILLCGDVEDYALGQLMATTDLRCDVLLLPHHGSVVPSTSAFIRSADPSVCLRSSGRPITDVLVKALDGRAILNTADHGSIEVFVAPGQFRVTPCVTSQ